VTVLARRGARVVVAALAGTLYVLPLAFTALQPLAVWLTRSYFVYTNAWDEETHLSYQGAWANRYRPGYAFPALVSVALHRLGVSGAIQNLASDLVVPAAVFLAAARLLRTLNPRARFPYAFLVVVGPLLFNLANPYLEARFWPVPAGWTASTLATLPTLRTPNPAWSFLLLALAAAAYARSRRTWWLAVPLPLAFWGVSVPYAVILGVIAAWRWLQRSSSAGVRRLAPVLAPVGVLVVAGLALGLAVSLLFAVDPILPVSRLANPCRAPLLSPNLLATVVFALVAAAASGVTPNGLRATVGPGLAGLVVAQVLTANVQVVTGRCFDPPSFQNAAGSTMSALALVAALECVSRAVTAHRPRLGAAAAWWLRTALVVVLVALAARSAGFDWQRKAFRLFVNEQLHPDDLARVRRDPLHAVFYNESLGARMTLLAPRALAPPLVYQYAFYGYTRSRTLAGARQEDAIRFAERQVATDPRAASWKDEIAYRIATYREFSAGWPPGRPLLDDRAALPEERLEPGEMYAVSGYGNVWLWWPDWSRATWRERFAFTPP